MYSAIKINGKKLYEYARLGKTVETKPRIINIYDIYLNNFDKKNNEITFTIECSKGTYIRTLCENIAEKLNEVGCVKELQRIQVGKFNISNSITIDELKQNKDNLEFLNKNIISFEEVLGDKPYITISNKQIEQFLNGVKLEKKVTDGIYKIKNEDNIFLGTAQVKEGFLKRNIIL